MSKIVLGFVVAVMLTGCTWQDVENTWTTGRSVGGVVLSDGHKTVATPVADTVEGIYEFFKDSTGKSVK